MPLTDLAIRNAKPAAKPVKLSDGGGLFLLITPAGGKLWRLKFRVDNKEKGLALGSYPAVGLAEARKRREEAKAQLAQGLDPAREKKRAKLKAQMQARAVADASSVQTVVLPSWGKFRAVSRQSRPPHELTAD